MMWQDIDGAVESGATNVRLERRSGTLVITVDGTEVVRGPAPELISYVSIFAVRYKSSQGTLFAFGSVELRTLTVCR